MKGGTLGRRVSCKTCHGISPNHHANLMMLANSNPGYHGVDLVDDHVYLC